MKRAGVILGFRICYQEANLLQLGQGSSRFVSDHFQDFADVQRRCEFLGHSKNIFKALSVDVYVRGKLLRPVIPEVEVVVLKVRSWRRY
jgi:hypothetical protein